MSEANTEEFRQIDNASLEEVPALLPSAIVLARLLETDPATLSASLHYLAFGRPA